MKYIVLVVSLLAILALVQAEDDAVEVAPSDEASDSSPHLESAPPADEQEAEADEHPHRPRHGQEQGDSAGEPPKRIPVFKIGFSIDTGK